MITVFYKSKTSELFLKTVVLFSGFHDVLRLLDTTFPLPADKFALKEQDYYKLRVITLVYFS